MDTDRIRQLNDAFRTECDGSGQVVITHGISALPPIVQMRIFREVMSFSDFSEGNNPHGEHDFGSFEIDGNKVFWKIDYYDKSMDFGSPDPADPDVTTRVLTIMLAEEY